MKPKDIIKLKDSNITKRAVVNWVHSDSIGITYLKANGSKSNIGNTIPIKEFSDFNGWSIHET